MNPYKILVAIALSTTAYAHAIDAESRSTAGERLERRAERSERKAPEARERQDRSKDPNLEKPWHPKHETEGTVLNWGLGEGSRNHGKSMYPNGEGHTAPHSDPPQKPEPRERSNRGRGEG